MEKEQMNKTPDLHDNLSETGQKELLEKAMNELKRFVFELSADADLNEDQALDLWNRISQSEGVLKELAFYHDNGRFWCKYQVAGYTLADILVWQVDHFKAYMDRHEQMNRYRQNRLFLESLDIMLQMESHPEPWILKMQSETGTDRINP